MRCTLVDIGFNENNIGSDGTLKPRYSREDKHVVFYMLSVALKSEHSRNRMVESFEPKDIMFDTDADIFYFGKTSEINTNFISKEEAIFNNIVSFANLAFVTHLPDYDLNKGLLNTKVISEQFDKFAAMFSLEDLSYYRSILVTAFNEKKLPEVKYFSDFISGNIPETKDKQELGRAIVKATAAGKMFPIDNGESGFGRTFFLTCMVATTIIAFIGILLYFLK